MFILSNVNPGFVWYFIFWHKFRNIASSGDLPEIIDLRSVDPKNWNVKNAFLWKTWKTL